MMTDQQLLSAYVDHQDTQAFDTLARRHVNWVHAMAARLLRDRSLADDVAQAVFVLLGRKAPSLRKEMVVSTWLFSVTRYCASNAMRNEIRRRKHERIAATEKSRMATNDPSPEWETLAPLLDECVSRLRCGDRQAVMMRFYEQKSFPEIGQTLLISEDAARKRVSRAIEQLRQQFARRGVRAGSAALSAVIAAHVAPPASAAVTAGATAAATLAVSAPLGSITSGVSAMLIWSGLKPAIPIVAALLLGVAAVSLFMQLPSRPLPLASAPSSKPAPSALTSPATAPEVKYYAGRVLDPDQKPIPGARVFLVSPAPGAPTPTATATSGQQGEFRLAEGKETPQIVAIAPGFGVTGVRAPLDDSPVEIRMRRAAEIHARFVTPDLKPIANARVAPLIASDTRLRWEVTFPLDFQDQFSVVSDADGNIVMPGMPQDARIQLGVMDDRFIAYYGEAGIRGTTARGGGTARGPRSSPTPQAWVGPSPIVQAGTFRVPLAASISGRVTYADGRGAGNIQVRSQVTGSRGTAAPPNLSAVTDPQGQYRLKRLDSLEYDLMLVRGGGVLSAFNAPLRPHVSAVAGHDTPDTDFVLTSGATLKGRVIDQKTQRPMPGVTVGISGPATPQTPIVFQEIITGVDGTYEAHVPPGLQRIIVQPNLNGSGPSTAPSVDVADGQTLSVTDIAMIDDSRPVVRGMVVDATGRGVGGALVAAFNQGFPTNLIQSGEGVKLAVSDAEGHFAMPRVRVGMRANLRATRGSTLASEVSSVPATDQSVTLRLDEVPPGALTTVRIRVIDPDGGPVPDAKVSLMMATAAGRTRVASPRGARAAASPQVSYLYSSSFELMITGADGWCVFDGLPTDKPYGLSIRANGFADENLINLHFETDPEQIITMKRADSFVAGIVVNDAGDSVPNMEVMVSSGRSASRSTRTDDTGQFRIEGVPFGETLNLSVREAFNSTSSTATAVVQGGRDDVLVVTRPAAPRSTPRGGNAPAANGP